MELTEQQIKAIVTEAVREALDNSRKAHECSLEAVGISDETHCQHHMLLNDFVANRSIVKSALIKVVITALGTGLLSLLWWAIWNSPKK